jgi:hypothetical protein
MVGRMLIPCYMETINGISRRIFDVLGKFLRLLYLNRFLGILGWVFGTLTRILGVIY